jgi:alpha-galactosidase
MRTVTALFGHAGLEWDVTTCSDEELERLRAWSALYREMRGLLHSGDVVRVDHPDPGAWLHGVVSADRREALFAYVRLATSPEGRPGRLCLAGLDPATEYEVARRDDAGVPPGDVPAQPDWWGRGGTVATGAVLHGIGLPAPPLDPEQAVVLHLRAR